MIDDKIYEDIFNALLKFDPDQPRDEFGRWTDGIYSEDGKRIYVGETIFTEDGIEYTDVSKITKEMAGGNWENVVNAQGAYEQLQNLGINVDYISYSETSFGNSFYMFFELDGVKYKVRSSDHNVSSFARMTGEMHIYGNRLFPLDYMKLERTKYPDRYEKFIREWYDELEEGESRTKPTDIIISTRISKAGKPVNLVKRRRWEEDWRKKKNNS